MAGTAYAGQLILSSEANSAGPNDGNQQIPWKYQPLNEQETAQLAYDGYPGHGCMYAVANALVSQLSQKFGSPYNQFPLNMLNYGHGGVGGFGSLCGALNGGAMLMGLFCHDRKICDNMISQLYKWYEQEELPQFIPANSGFTAELPRIQNQSVICHASVSKWCMKAECSPDDPIRTERCRRMCGDVVIQVIRILNNFSQDQVKGFVWDAHSGECMECHGVDEAKMFKSKTKMNCQSCHTDPHN